MKYFFIECNIFLDILKPDLFMNVIPVEKIKAAGPWLDNKAAAFSKQKRWIFILILTSK